MKASTLANKFFAVALWNKLPAFLQKSISMVWAIVYRWKISSLFIRFFCNRYELDSVQLELYRPASGSKKYNSFQDFFTRQLKHPVSAHVRDIISPCQGFVCENGWVTDFDKVEVKGRNYTVRDIFEQWGEKITSGYFFMNIFLHNHNYHRLHSPVSGTVAQIRNISGHLNFLRPWLYDRKSVSTPSFVNERCMLEIVDAKARSWFLTFVGGMGVGQIRITEGLQVGSSVMAGDELGYFLLGSTCCIAAPVELKKFGYLQKIDVGDSLLANELPVQLHGQLQARG